MVTVGGGAEKVIAILTERRRHRPYLQYLTKVSCTQYLVSSVRHGAEPVFGPCLLKATHSHDVDRLYILVFSFRNSGVDLKIIAGSALEDHYWPLRGGRVRGSSGGLVRGLVTAILRSV